MRNTGSLFKTSKPTLATYLFAKLSGTPFLVRGHSTSIWVWLANLILVGYGFVASSMLKYLSAAELLVVNVSGNPVAAMLSVAVFNLAMTRDYVLGFLLSVIGVHVLVCAC